MKPLLTKKGPTLFWMLLNDELAPLIKVFGKGLAQFGENLQFRLYSERSRRVQRRCLFQHVPAPGCRHDGDTNSVVVSGYKSSKGSLQELVLSG